MADGYRTNDGKTFTNRDEAQRHANYLVTMVDSADAQNARLKAEYHGYFLIAQQAQKDFNAGNWDAVIKAVDKQEALIGRFHSSTKITSLYPIVGYMKYIALANRDGNFTAALEKTNWGKPYNGKDDYERQLHAETLEAAKKAWAKKYGRVMTDADIAQLISAKNDSKVVEYEKMLSKYINSVSIEDFRNYPGETQQQLVENKINWINSCIENWEKRTGRKLTRQEQIRIAGKPFSKGGSPKGKGKGGVVVVVIIIIVGLYFGRGFLLPQLDKVRKLIPIDRVLNLLPVKTEQTTEE